MLDSSYGPINTTIRVYENYLLSKNQYDRMLEAKYYEDAVIVLHDTIYRDEVDEAVKNQNYDPMLLNELVKTYNWVKEQSPSQELIELITLKYAYHNIEVLFKEKYMDKDFSHTLINIGAFPIYEYRKAIATGHSDVLPQKYVDNINDIHTYFDEMPSIKDLDVYLDRVYFDHMLTLAREIDDPEVTQYIKHLIDLSNLSVFFRALANGQSRNHIQAVLSEGGTVPIEIYLNLASENMDNAVNELRKTKFRDIIESAMVKDKISLSELERNIDNAEIEYLSQAKMKVFGPLPIIAYLNAKETEVKNIRLVLASKINSIDPAIVRDRMRLNYAL